MIGNLDKRDFRRVMVADPSYRGLRKRVGSEEVEAESTNILLKKIEKKRDGQYPEGRSGE